MVVLRRQQLWHWHPHDSCRAVGSVAVGPFGVWVFGDRRVAAGMVHRVCWRRAFDSWRVVGFVGVGDVALGRWCWAVWHIWALGNGPLGGGNCVGHPTVGLMGSGLVFRLGYPLVFAVGCWVMARPLDFGLGWGSGSRSTKP